MPTVRFNANVGPTLSCYLGDYITQSKMIVSFFWDELNLNLNSLLVKRQIDNPSPGAVTGGN